MKLLSILVAAVALATVTSAQRCCTPQQWEGELTGANYAINDFFWEDVHYDFQNQRARFDVFSNDNRSVVVNTIIERFDQGRIYNIFPGPKGNCTYFIVSGKMPEACTPQNPSGVYPYTIGITLNARVYEFAAPNGIFQAWSVTADQCIPINGNYFARRHGQYQDYIFFYYNIFPSISDPAIFNPPGQCTQIKN